MLRMTNIALVVLDTLRKDAFDEHFDWLPGRTFEAAYSTANWTVPAHASLFTGKYSSEVGVTAKSISLDCPDPALPEVLADAGYRTRGFSANHNASAQNDFDRGFEEFVNPKRLHNPEYEKILDWEQFLAETDAEGLELYGRAVLACLRGDHATVPSLKIGLGKKLGRIGLTKTVEDSGARSVLQHVRDANFGDREFLFVNLMEAHTPYDPPAAFNSQNEAVSVSLKDSFSGVDEPETVRRAYDDAVRYLSATYQEMYEELAAEFDYVVTLSDHGELLGEHGYWNHTYGLYPELTQVPLVVTDTSQSVRTVCEKPVSLLDVHRTILELAGVEADSRGQSLLGEIEPRDRLAEYRGLIAHAIEGLQEVGFDESDIEQYEREFDALVGGDGRYAVAMPDGWVPEDVDAETVRKRMDAVRETVTEVAVDPDEEDASEETLKRLEQLGYR